MHGFVRRYKFRSGSQIEARFLKPTSPSHARPGHRTELIVRRLELIFCLVIKTGFTISAGRDNGFDRGAAMVVIEIPEKTNRKQREPRRRPGFNEISPSPWGRQDKVKFTEYVNSYRWRWNALIRCG